MALFVVFTWYLPYKTMQRCLDSGGAYAQSLAQCDNELKNVPASKLVGLVFIRMIDGKRVSYMQEADLPNVGLLNGHKFSMEVNDQGTRYRMITRGETLTGELSTERGLGNDTNAVVYVLKPSHAPDQQLRFVQRKQGEVNLLQLSTDGQVMEVSVP